jgi:transposase
MPRGVELNDVEKGQIKSYKEEGVSNREIARRLGRSDGLIRNFITKKDNYGTCKRSGRKKKLTDRTKRRILKEITNTNKGVRTLKNELAPQVHHTTVWRAIKSSPSFVRRKLRKVPKLNEQHKVARVAWAEQRMWWTNTWSRVSGTTSF